VTALAILTPAKDLIDWYQAPVWAFYIQQVSIRGRLQPSVLLGHVCFLLNMYWVGHRPPFPGSLSEDAVNVIKQAIRSI